jgi:hypothetical protein
MAVNKIILYFLTGISFIVVSCSTAKWVQLDKEMSLNCLQNFLTDSTHNALSNDILIPDEETAINIAETFLFKVYGKNKIIKERPYKIGLVNNYWVIIGSLPKYYRKGGTFEIIINSKDGSVKGITHTK